MPYHSPWHSRSRSPGTTTGTGLAGCLRVPQRGLPETSIPAKPHQPSQCCGKGLYSIRPVTVMVMVHPSGIRVAQRDQTAKDAGRRDDAGGADSEAVRKQKESLRPQVFVYR